MPHINMQISKSANKQSGFTLIELLVVISIIGVLMGLSIFGLQGARQASRDSKRKADLELLRSGIEIYRSDCSKYPSADPALSPSSALAVSGTALIGDNSSTACATTNVYISQIPLDPISPVSDYLYWSDGVSYELCASLEQGGTTVTCGGSSACGGGTCNYKVTNP
jgi:general secretion pathway protein G